MSGVAERLEVAGLLPDEARRKAEVFAGVDAALETWRTANRGVPVERRFVPGRIEVLGRHMGAGGGRSLLAALGRGVCIAAAPREDALLRIRDAGRGLSAELPLDAPPQRRESGWERSALAAAALLSRDVPNLRGADVALGSDLPRGAGLSSSTAFAAGILAVLAAVNRGDDRSGGRDLLGSPERLAAAIGAIEESSGEEEGDAGGSPDAAAIAGARAGAVSQWAFRPLRHERFLPLDDVWRFVVAVSGVSGDRTEARGLFRRSAESAEAILALWNRSTGRKDATLFSALATGPDAHERLRRLVRALPVPRFEATFLEARLAQFVEEALELVPAAGDLIARGEVARLEEPVARSAALAERCFGAWRPEPAFLARSALRLGACAASCFGGSAPSVWALVATVEAGAFRRRWAEDYGREHPGPAAASRFFATRPGPSIVRI